MGIFGERDNEKNYRDIIKAVKSSKLDKTSILFLLLIRNTLFLVEAFVEKFTDNIRIVKFMLPQGVNTPGFESIKRELILNYDNLLNNNLFSEEFYSLFESRNDYLQVMNIILKDDNLKDNFDSIVSFAVQLGKEVDVTGYCCTIENFFNFRNSEYHEIMFVHFAEFKDEDDKKIEHTIKNAEGREELEYRWLDLDKIDEYLFRNDCKLQIIYTDIII